MKTGYLMVGLLVVSVFSFTQLSATPSTFWDTLSEQKVTGKSATRYYKPRTNWERSRSSRIKKRVSYSKPAKTNTSSCYVKAALHLPNRCVRKNKETRKGIISQINYLKSTGRNVSKKSRLRYASKDNRSLLNTANSLLDWFDHYSTRSLTSDFELHELDSRSGKVKYTGYFTPFISARKYPNAEYNHPIYGLPSGRRYPTRKAIFNGALRGKGLEIAWTNDPVSYFQAQVQGSGVLSFPNNKLVDLNFAGKTKAQFVGVARYMHGKGYINTPSNKAMRRWFERNPDQLERMLAVNPRFVFFKVSQYNKKRKTSSGQALIAGHTVAVDTQHIPFGSVLLAEVFLRNSKGKVVSKDWRLLFPQDRGGAIKGAKRLDLYTGEGSKAKKLTRAVTGTGRAYLLVAKQGRGRMKTVSNDY